MSDWTCENEHPGVELPLSVPKGERCPSCDAAEPVAASGHGSPPCVAECVPVLRAEWAKACTSAGVPVAEAHITHVAPLIPPLYEDLRMVCPHGVVWHMQPTSEQIAEWVREGVE